MTALPRQEGPWNGGHMVVCGDDGLAHLLAAELRDVYRQHVVLLVPAGEGDDHVTEPRGVQLPRAVAAPAPIRVALLHAGVDRAAALALLYEDDETNLRAALAARRLNPGLRLVVRMCNRKLGHHLEELLDQAAIVAGSGTDRAALDASTTVLSDADTAAPALVATAVADTNKVVQADGLLRAAERPASARGEVPDPDLCTLALLSSSTTDPAGSDGSDASGAQGPELLPDDRTVQGSAGRGTIVLEALRRSGPVLPPLRLSPRGAPLGEVFSARLRWSLADIVAAVLASPPPRPRCPTPTPSTRLT